MRNKPHKIPKTKAIKAIGIELEGAWTRYYTNGVPTRTYTENTDIIRQGRPKFMKYDGSVSIDRQDSGCEYVGEIASKPMQPRAITSWVRRNQPDAFNDTCGAHMHISTHSNGDYICLTDKKFWETFRTKIGRWGNKMNFKKNHEFWKRYEGKNSYCKPEFKPAEQLYSENTRYTQINYCWSKHKTLEFRILPIFETTDIQIESFYKKIWSVKETIKDYPKNFTTVYEEKFNEQKPYKSETILESGGSLSQSATNSKVKALFWNFNHTISLAKPMNPNAKKTYYIVTPNNAHLAPETMDHISTTRANLQPEIFDEEETDTPVPRGQTRTRELAANDITTNNRERDELLSQNHLNYFPNPQLGEI